MQMQMPLRRRVLVDLDPLDPKQVAMMTFHISTVQGISEHRSIGSCGGDPEDGGASISSLKLTEECPSILHSSGASLC